MLKGTISPTSRITLLLLLPKDQEMIKISDDEETIDHDAVAIAHAVGSVDEGSEVTDDDHRDVSDQ